MSQTDPIGDMLTKIRNACKAKHKKVDISASKTKMAITKILFREKLIQNYKYFPDNRQGVIRIYPKYHSEKGSVIRGLKRISTPGLHHYVPKDKIPKVLGGLGIAILSTSKGILTDKEAKAQGIGGEIICYIW
ncbi:MAG: 30S ribosomal protein S8 [Candidatus Edwardsbacteria bacterium]